MLLLSRATLTPRPSARGLAQARLRAGCSRASSTGPGRRSLVVACRAGRPGGRAVPWTNPRTQSSRNRTSSATSSRRRAPPLTEEKRITTRPASDMKADPGGPALRHPHRTGVPGGRNRRRELRRGLDRHRSERRLREDRRADPGGRRQVSRGSTTCRPTSTSGSTRCSRPRPIRSSSASSATTSRPAPAGRRGEDGHLGHQRPSRPVRRIPGGRCPGRRSR